MPNDITAQGTATPPFTGATPGPVPGAAADPSAQLDAQLQQLMTRTMAQRTHIPVPQQQPQQRQEMMQGPATTHAEGNQMFFHNLGALIGNAAQSAKQNQIKQATGVLQQLSNAHDKYQEMAIAQGATDPADIQKKTTQLMGQAPEVQEILSDKKKMKQLQKLGQLDLFNPDAKKDVMHEAATRVGKANKMQQAIKSIGQLMSAHRDQQQLKPPDQILNQVEDRSQLAPSDAKTSVAIASAEARMAQADARANQLQTQYNEKLREFDTNQKRLTDAAGLKDEEFKANQNRLDDTHKDLQDYRSQLLTLQKQRINQTVQNTDLRRIVTAMNYAPELLKPGEAEAFGMQVDENGKLIPIKSPLSVTAQTKNAAQQGGVMDKLIDETLNELKSPTLQAALGPYSGRVSEIIQGKIGENVPEFAALRTLGSFDASGMLKLHFGARGGGQQYDKFHNLIDTGKMDVASLNEALGAMKTVVGAYKGEVKTTRGTGPAKVSDLVKKYGGQ